MSRQSTFANIAASTTDGVIVAAAAGKIIRVHGYILQTGATATTFTFNSKGSGAGSPISMTFQNGANGGAVVPDSGGNGWFETASGEGLSGTSGAGSTTGVQVAYELVGL